MAPITRQVPNTTQQRRPPAQQQQQQPKQNQLATAKPVDEDALARFAAPADRATWWRERIARCREVLARAADAAAH